MFVGSDQDGVHLCLPFKYSPSLNIFYPQALMNSRALVRKLSSIEQLGCIDTLVVEKTGVLTENKLSVVNFVTNTAQDARDPDTGKVINFFKNFSESNKALLATIAACWLK